MLLLTNTLDQSTRRNNHMLDKDQIENWDGKEVITEKESEEKEKKLKDFREQAEYLKED